MAAGRPQTREGALYRRLARRRGKAKAQVALGNTQLKVYHELLSTPGARYQDLGVDYYDRRNIRRQTRAHVQRLESLGFNVTLTPIPTLPATRKCADPAPGRTAGSRVHPVNPAPLKLRRVLPRVQLESQLWSAG